MLRSALGCSKGSRLAAGPSGATVEAEASARLAQRRAGSQNIRMGRRFWSGVSDEIHKTKSAPKNRTSSGHYIRANHVHITKPLIRIKHGNILYTKISAALGNIGELIL